MTLYNNTPTQVFYNISSASSGDCGNIDPGQTVDWPGYDNQVNVTVSFIPSSGQDFSVTIPESETGKAVTIGIYLE